MFSCIDLYINNKLITNNSDTYSYRAYLENLFSYGSDVKDNQLKAAEFWSEDEPGALCTLITLKILQINVSLIVANA